MVKVLMILTFLFLALSVTEESGRSQESPNNQADSIVYITREGKKYHREECSFLNRSKLRVSLKEAIDNRFEPCKRCYKKVADTTSTP